MEIILAMLKGEGGGVRVVTHMLEVVAMIRGGGAHNFHPFKEEWGWGDKTFHPVLRGVGAKGFRPAIFPFCSPPPRT